MFKKYLNKGVCIFAIAALSVVAIAGCGGSSNPEAKAPEKFAPAPTEEPPVFDAGSPGRGRGDSVGTRKEEVLTLPGRGQ